MKLLEKQMNELWNLVSDSKKIAISGHVRPDGDCFGSTLALYMYLQENFNQDNKKTIDWLLEEPPKEFKFLYGYDKLQTSAPENAEYDLYIALDCGSVDRLGPFEPLFRKAKKTVSVDHHISNTSFAGFNYVIADASSTCEILAGSMQVEKISTTVAEALYLGIVHDTGVFKHSCTSPATMRAAAMLMEKNIRSTELIEKTFYQKTYIQNQILGQCLLESLLLLDGKIIVACVSKRMLEFYHGVPSDTDGVIDQMRSTTGVEVAILLREEEHMRYKVSMRSNGLVNVSKIAVVFGGGGHVRAAGCTLNGTWRDVVNNLAEHIEAQLKEAE